MARCGYDFKKCCPRLTKDVLEDALSLLESDGYKVIDESYTYDERGEIILEAEDIEPMMRKGAVIRFSCAAKSREEATISFPTIHQIDDAERHSIRLCHGQEDAMQCLSKFVQDKRDKMSLTQETWFDMKRDMARDAAKLKQKVVEFFTL